MSNAFATEAQCREYLARHLPELGESVDSRIRGAVLDAYVKAAARRRRGFELSIGGWVIKDGDLEMFGAVQAAGVALASSKAWSSSLEVSVLVSFFFALATLVRNAYRSGVRLGPEDMAVLGLLVVHRKVGLTTQQIAIMLEQRGEPQNVGQVEAALRRLSAVPNRVGVSELVKELPSGEWVSCDV